MLGARLWEKQKEDKRKQAEAAAKTAAEQEAKIMDDFMQGRTGGIDISILRAFLEGASWADSFDQFLIAHCPQFATFVVGQEYGLNQSDIHLTFVATAEGLLDQQLGQIGASAENFLEQVMSDMKTAPPGSPAAIAAGAVLQRLEECADFERFGLMMRQRFESIQAAEEQLPGGQDDDDAWETAVDSGGPGDGGEAELMREQQQIKADRERRMRARKEAMDRATAAALELDKAEAESEPEPAAADEIHWQDGSDFGAHRPFLAGWEVGSVHRGVVSFWEHGQSQWGMGGVGGYGMICKCRSFLSEMGLNIALVPSRSPPSISLTPRYNYCSENGKAGDIRPQHSASDGCTQAVAAAR